LRKKRMKFGRSQEVEEEEEEVEKCQGVWGRGG
jgi:hypothetical protein